MLAAHLDEIGLIPVFLGLVGPSLMPGLEDHEQIVPALAREHLSGERQVRFRAFRFRVVEHDGKAVARRFAEPDIARDDRVECLFLEELADVFRHLLPWPVDAPVPSMQRVAVEAVIAAPEFPGGALRVITTHLEYYSAKQRAVQVKALREICDAGWRHAVAPRSPGEPDPPFVVLPRGESCVLCGDFNSPAGSPELLQ